MNRAICFSEEKGHTSENYTPPREHDICQKSGICKGVQLALGGSVINQAFPSSNKIRNLYDMKVLEKVPSYVITGEAVGT